MPKARWMKKVKSPDRPSGSAPVTRIEAILEDLKGNPITNRVLKDTWGGNSDMMKSAMDAIIDQVASSPDLDQSMIANDQSRGFYAAGTTTTTDPSRNPRLMKTKESYAEKHTFGPGMEYAKKRKLPTKRP